MELDENFTIQVLESVQYIQTLDVEKTKTKMLDRIGKGVSVGTKVGLFTTALATSLAVTSALPAVGLGVGALIVGTAIGGAVGGAVGAVAGGISKGAVPSTAQDSLDKAQVEQAFSKAEKELFEIDETLPNNQDKKRSLKESIRHALCPSLIRTSDDVFEIAKVSTPILISLSFTGTISMPIQPVFFAAAALLLARSGVATVCKGK